MIGTMPLKEQQDFLARLYTNKLLRKRFFTDPQGVGVEAGLTTGDIKALCTMEPSTIEDFAQSLVHKRMGQIPKYLPITCKLLEKKFHPIFHSFTEQYTPHGSKKHREDAIAFATYLRELQPSREDLPLWLIEVAAYEANRQEIQHPDFRWMIRRYRYPVHRMIRAIQENKEVVPKPRAMLFLWIRYHRKKPIIQKRWKWC